MFPAILRLERRKENMLQLLCQLELNGAIFDYGGFTATREPANTPGIDLMPILGLLT